MIMNNETLYEILSSESEALSSVEIESILNDELDKSPDEMDTDLVDLCLEALNTVDEKKLNMRKRKISIGKILVAAVIFVTAILISIPVCAKYLNINVPDGVVTIYKDCFYIDISPDGTIRDIAGRLEEDGINDAILPNMIFVPETKNSDYSKQETGNCTMINFNFTDNEIEGHVTIQKYSSDYKFFIDEEKESLEFEQIDYFEINGIKILVLGNNDVSHILYATDNIEYNFLIECNHDTACKIAKSI